jgi:hypothetical protein
MSAQLQPESQALAAMAASLLYPIFPCNPVNKRPLTEHGFKDASQDTFKILKWWSEHPYALIGVPTGAASGLDVVDVDTARKPDPASSAWIEANRAHLAGARQQITRSGGTHFIFKHDPSVDIGTRKGIIAEGAELASIDTRGNGGYIIDWGAHGYAAQGDIQPMAAELAAQLHRRRTPRKSAQIPAGAGVHPSEAAPLKTALTLLDPANYDHCVKLVGMALHHAGGQEAFDLWHDFCAGKFTTDGQPPHNYGGYDWCAGKWESFGKHLGDKTTIASVIFEARKRAPSALVAPVPMPQLAAIPPPPVSVLVMNRKMQFEATIEALSYVLGTQRQASIGFDEFRGRIMIAPAGTEEWRPLSDTDMIQLRETLAREQRFAPIGKELMHDALLLVASRHRFDSAITWLDGLKWDDVPRIERFLVTYCGTVDDEYARAVGLYIWTGLAGRVLDPGCQLDMVVAFQSPQGKMKSTGFQAMVPADDYFTDGLSLQDDDDNFKRLIRGKLVIEVAELAGLSKADINVVKRVITRRHEEWIEKWQTQPTRFKRRCMLFASTNEERFLPQDDTGQRRWVPVEITKLDRDRIAQDRDQLWAEGAARWGTGGVAWKEAERLAAGRHSKYEQTDIWETTIEGWLRTPGTLDKILPASRPLSLTEILAGAVGLNAAHQDAKAEKRAARVMRQLGFEPRPVRVDGELVRRWMPR